MKKKKKTIGGMTGQRRKWMINPVTRIKNSKKAYNRRKKYNYDEECDNM